APKHTEDYFNIPEADWKLNCFIAFTEKKIRGLERMTYLGADLSTIIVSDELCVICKKDYHLPERCEFSVDERKATVKANRLCIRCLVVEYFHGHHCEAICAHCKGEHHLALCHSYRPTSVSFANKSGVNTNQHQVPGILSQPLSVEQ